MKITLPNNNLGLTVMAISIFIIATLPFVLVFWLVGLIAPWYVSVPMGFSSSFLALVSLVKTKDKK